MAPPRTQRCHLCGQEAQIQACTHQSAGELLAVTGCGCGGFEVTNCLVWQLTIPVMKYPANPMAMRKRPVIMVILDTDALRNNYTSRIAAN